ncbi:hypothetical protein CALCODRAFT_300262 [Calocera cornea HHB12733]|uniref:RING-type domain-containing protein n=1 Tax=Calocera cornea HHB12733 TaxID=1353952 RepID=A0A165FKC0_9BASI|nr:hypothetical protein CALCODRAFT_300262 [Calocera cornea HHB12733]
MYRCQICFDELGTNGQTTCTPCGHAFCSDCLAHALRIQAFCPSCRSPVEPKLETLPAVEAQALITELCRKTPGRRHELERLGPRPVRLYLDKDEADQPPGEGDDVIARQQRKIAKLSARLGEAEKMIELVKTEKHDELALLKAQMKVLHRRSQAAVDRAWELETQMEETERQSNVFFDIVAKERVALEQALHAKDQELKKAKSKEARYDKDVQDLKDSLADARKRDAEHMEQIGEAAHTMKRKQKKVCLRLIPSASLRRAHA